MPAPSSRAPVSTGWLLLLSLGAAACGGGGAEPRVPTTASLSATTVTLTAIGQTTQPTATVTDQHGNAISTPALTWTSSNAAVAVVTSAGLVTAAGNGSATITAAAGSASAQADVTVTQVPAQLQKVAGDGQTAIPGQPVASPLTVRVNDARTADGRLALRPQADSLQRSPPMLGVHDITTIYPVAGALDDIDPEALGATRTGALEAGDPLAPGVLGIERRTAAGASPSILLRLGSDANRRGVVRFDGGYFVLTVQRLQPRGFIGTWSSGSAGEKAAGYFCAERSVR
jgi:hypothetical protein